MKKEAKLESLKKMKDKMKKKMMDKKDMSDFSKVTVMAKDKKGLEKGLSKAQEIMKKKFKEGGVGTGEGQPYQDDGMDFRYEAPLKGGYEMQNPTIRKAAKAMEKKKK